MTGKKILRWARAFADEFDLSGDARTFDGLDNAMEGVDMHGWSDSHHWFLPDLLRQIGVKGFQALLNDATSGAFTALKDRPVTVFSLAFGDGAEPAVGDPAYLIGGAQFKDTAGWDGQAAVIQADILTDETSGAQPVGNVMLPKTALSATGTSAAVNNGAASSNGFSANLHITAGAGVFAFVLEQSATGAFGGEETTLGSFTIDGSAAASERITGTGAVAQYVRFKRTRTSGTCTAFCSMARN